MSVFLHLIPVICSHLLRRISRKIVSALSVLVFPNLRLSSLDWISFTHIHPPTRDVITTDRLAAIGLKLSICV